MLRNPIVSTFFGLSIVLTFIAASVASLGLYGIEGPFIIHFNYLGEVDFIGGSENVRNIIITVGITIFINLILAFRLYNREKFLAYALSGASFLVSLLAVAAVYLISSVN